MVRQHYLLLLTSCCITYIYAVAPTDFLLECSSLPKNISQEQCRDEDTDGLKIGCYRNQNGYGAPCIELCPVGGRINESDLNHCNDKCRGYIDGHCKAVKVTVSPISTTTDRTGEGETVLPVSILAVTLTAFIIAAVPFLVKVVIHNRKRRKKLLRDLSKSDAEGHCAGAEECYVSTGDGEKLETIPQQPKDSDSEYEVETSGSLLAVAADCTGPSEKKPDSQDCGLAVDVHV